MISGAMKFMAMIMVILMVGVAFMPLSSISGNASPVEALSMLGHATDLKAIMPSPLSPGYIFPVFSNSSIFPAFIEGFGTPVPFDDFVIPVISKRGVDDAPDDYSDSPVPDDDFSAPQPTPDDMPCGWPKLTRKLWDSGEGEKVVKWANAQAKQYANYQAHLPDDRKQAFYWYLAGAWAPRLTTDISACNGGRFCSIVSCDFIAPTHPQSDEHRRLAYYAFQVFNSWYEDQTFLREDLVEAINGMDLRLYRFIKDFTDADTLVASLRQQKLELAQKLHSMGLVLLTVQPIIDSTITAAGAVTGDPVAAGVVKTIIDSSIGAYMGASSLAQDSDRFDKDPHWTLTTDLGELFHDMRTLIEGLVTNNTNLVINGQTDSDQQPFINILKTSTWVERKMRDPSRKERLEKQLTRVVINQLWNSAMIYIVRADSIGCEYDYRVPLQVRVCLKEDPSSVYEILFIGSEKQDRKRSDPILLRGPPGYMLFGSGDYKDVTLQQVVRDSVRYKKLNGFEMRAPDKDYFSEALQNVNHGADSDIQWPTFTIPILENPGGEALSSINDRDSRNYPIMSICPWNHVTRECNDEHQRFLQRTGMFGSRDYKTMLREHHHHRVKFDESRTLTWDTKYPESVQVSHPIKEIGHWADHKILGHEDAGDDGLRDHKDKPGNVCGDPNHHRNDPHRPCVVHDK